jgi:L-fuculose-phosphate aldolase
MNEAGDPRQALLAAARRLQAGGLNVGSAGNLSVRHGDGMLITPSGVPYDRLRATELVELGLDGGRSPEVGLAPSSEWRFHAAVYETLADAGAVVHAHSTFATVLACLGRGIPAFHYEVALAGGADIPCAPYATFSTPELAVNVTGALAGRRACLLAHHGLVTWGETLDRALALAEKVEHLAEIYCECLKIGEPDLLGPEEMARVVEMARDYGRPSDA